MAVSTEITKLQTNLANAYTAVATKEGTIPQDQNFDNLSAAISTITSGAEVEAEVSIEIDEINGESI